MRLRFVMKVKSVGEEVASKLESVLEPDNKSVPTDQRFSMVRIKNSLIFKVESERAFSALATVEGLLNDLHLFKEVWLLSS